MPSPVEEGKAGGRKGRMQRRLDQLTGGLDHELRLIEDLRGALLRQRAAVAADQAEAIESSVHAIGRTLFTLDEAGRHRSALIAVLAGNPDVALSDLGAHLGIDMPATFVAARDAVRHAASATSLELAINQTILQGALEAGDAFLQQLFSSRPSSGPVEPTARTGPVEHPISIRAA